MCRLAFHLIGVARTTLTPRHPRVANPLGDAAFFMSGMPLDRLDRPQRSSQTALGWTYMRKLLHILLLTLLFLPFAAFADEAELRAFGRSLGLRDLDGFVAAVETIRTEGRLPERWITKRQAQRLGWRPGEDLCDVAEGRAIGGDRFGNREGRLPDRRGRRWTEADLDFDCGRRGAKRLVFSSDRLIFVTVDHYDSFHEVPE